MTLSKRVAHLEEAVERLRAIVLRAEPEEVAVPPELEDSAIAQGFGRYREKVRALEAERRGR